MPIQIVRNDITHLRVDASVNAAPQLVLSGGVTYRGDRQGTRLNYEVVHLQQEALTPIFQGVRASCPFSFDFAGKTTSQDQVGRPSHTLDFESLPVKIMKKAP